MSPSEFLFGLLTSGNADGTKTAMVSKLLSSIMMNGLPLLGLYDYVEMSDVINSYIGKRVKSEVLGNSAYRDKFGNFLDVRQKEIRITPRNCWTLKFYDAIKLHSQELKVMRCNTYICRT